MNSLHKLADTIRKIAKKAVEESKPVQIVYGNVISVSPLKISVDQKLILESEDLILTQNVLDYSVDMTVDGIRKKYTIHNAIRIGESVVLLSEQGGQKYLVLDRVVT